MGVNPYEPPTEVPVEPAQPMEVVRGQGFLTFEWTAVLMFNLLVPILLAWSMTSHQAKLGVAFAIALVACLGYYLCLKQPTAILLVIRGGILVALSQVFPVLQIVCGASAIQSLIAIGWIPNSSFQQMLSSVAAGFFVTLLTGTFLILLSFFAGLLLRWVTPRHWWVVQRPFPRSHGSFDE